MPRKITPLKHIYPKDQRAISILSKSGAMSRDTFHKLQISDNRIKSYQKAGLIKEVSVPDKHGTGFRNYYELTEKQGKDFARSECGVNNFISNGNASVHNNKVSEYLVDNLSKKEFVIIFYVQWKNQINVFYIHLFYLHSIYSVL